jgi:hypothetical protein
MNDRSAKKWLKTMPRPQWIRQGLPYHVGIRPRIDRTALPENFPGLILLF